MFQFLGPIVSALGGSKVATAVAGGVGSLLGARADRKNDLRDFEREFAAQNELRRQSLLELPEMERKTGINRLELLRGGGSQVPMGPRVGTSTLWSNAFDQVHDAITGQQAHELQERKIEALETDIAQDQRATGKIGSKENPYRPGGWTPDDDIEQPTGPGPHGYWDYGKITLVGPNKTDVPFPKIFAKKLGLYEGEPLTFSIFEEIAGDELGQAFFVDIAANNGIEIRYGEKASDLTIKRLWNAFTGKNYYTGETEPKPNTSEQRRTRRQPRLETVTPEVQPQTLQPSSGSADRRRRRLAN